MTEVGDVRRFVRGQRKGIGSRQRVGGTEQESEIWDKSWIDKLIELL